MPTAEIPPRNPLPATPAAASPGSDLYDAESWESAYREMHGVPTLLIQLQDDLSRSRQREAFWISVVVHLAIVILAVNSNRLENLLHRRAVLVVGRQDLMKQKELTYLELPPDEQKITKRPDTNKISDKDRVATSRAPQLDRRELKKILDSARPGAPRSASPPAPSQQSAPPAPAAEQNSPPQEQPSPQPPPRPAQNQVARLPTPPVAAPTRTFSTGAISAGSAIEQSARAAITNRGGYAGDNGDYGLGRGKQPAEAIGPLDVLSDTMGVDFSPYLARVLHDVRENWYRIIPESARAPLMKRGKVSIEFAILKDGQVAGLQIVGTSGDVALDRAAYGGITASKPFPPLPTEFGGQYLGLRFHFYYNPDKADLE